MDSSDKITLCAIGSSRSSHVRDRVKWFADRGHRVHLITEKATGIEGVEEITPRPLPIPKLKTISLLLSYIRCIRRCRADIVHVHFAQGLGSWTAAVVDLHPLVVSVMGGDILFEERGNSTPRGRWLTRQLLLSADLVTVKSYYLMSVLDKLDGHGAKAIKVVWGVDQSRFQRVDASAFRRKLGIPPDAPVILSPKILKPFYNVHLIVEAMPRIIKKTPSTTLLITEYHADTAYKEEIVARVRALGLEQNVRFVGEIEHDDMPYFYSLADISVAVPPSDGLPQTLFEAMACEVPNILSRLSRYEEVVAHEESAYFVNISPQDIADGVLRLLSNSELRNKIVTNGLQIVKSQADFKTEVDRVEEKYYELLKAPRSKRGWLERVRILLTLILFLVIDARRRIPPSHPTGSSV